MFPFLLASQAILAAARGVSAQAFEERRGSGWLCHLVLRSARPKVESELEAGHSLGGETGLVQGC